VSLDPPVDRARDHVRGGDSGVSLVEYGDFECPFCRSAEPSLIKAADRLDANLTFTFRHFPLRDKHPNAQMAAEAAEAAGAQGRFWEMHDRLLASRDLEPGDLHAHAEALGLDVERFDRDLATHAFAGRVEEDVRSGTANGVTGTPTLFLNGERYTGFYDTESLFEAVLDAQASV
jgi:protein-disulfide isomerase